MDSITIIIAIAVGVISIIIGFAIAKVLEKKQASKMIQEAKKEASTLLKDAKSNAENVKKDKILQAKEKFLELKAEHEKFISSKDKKMAEAEKRTRDKESQVSSELSKNKKLNQEIEAKLKDYDYRLDFVEKKKTEVERLHKSQIEQLEVISGLSADEAKEQLVSSLKEEAKSDAMGYIQAKLEEAKMTAQQEAKKVIINTIQ